MNMIVKLFNFGIPVLFGAADRFSGLFLAGKVPADRDVLRELHQLLREAPFNRQIPEIHLHLEWLKSIIETLAALLRYPLQIVLVIAVLIGLYFLIHSLAPYVRTKSLPDQATGHAAKGDKGLPPNYFFILYQQALDQSKAGLQRQALVSLHKATVEYILTKVIIASPHKKYTNNDLKRKLSAYQSLYQPFCIITRYAEIAGFSAAAIHQADFDQALEVFKASFL